MVTAVAGSNFKSFCLLTGPFKEFQSMQESDLDIWPVCLHTLMSCLIDLMKFLAFTFP